MAQIETATELRSLYGEATILAQKKNLDHIDGHARAFIERSPFVVLSTADAAGWPDSSPRGDPPGFLTVEGPHTLLLPDRPGNKRVDSFNNVISNPKVGLLFLVPGHSHSLRVNGTARLLSDEGLCKRFAVQGKAALAVLEVTALECSFIVASRSSALGSGSRRNGPIEPVSRVLEARWWTSASGHSRCFGASAGCRPNA